MGTDPGHSLLGRGAPRWVPPPPSPMPDSYPGAVGLTAPVAELLYRRGLTAPAAARAFLDGELPPPPDLPDLRPGAELVLAAVRAGEPICVYGDYDADGVTATALLVRLLRELGVSPSYHVPNRFREGYGLNRGVLTDLAAAGVRLVLTCDCGVSGRSEVAHAQSLGLTVVVTDHHELPAALPECPVITPRRLPETDPFHWLSGVGTAWLFARELLRQAGRDPAVADGWLELVAVGLIADVMPLTGANRALVRRGLSRLWSTPLAGLKALCRVAGLTEGGDEEDVAFQLAPRLNAAGRLADAGLAVRLLLTDDAIEAGGLASELDRLNTRRKQLSEVIKAEARAEVTAAGGPGPLIALYRPGWHEGVLGLVAGQLAQEYGVPVALMARRTHGDGVVGSARAPAGFPLFAAISGCAALLERYGGHHAAAGFSLAEAHVPAFRERLAAMAVELAPAEPPPALQVADVELPLGQVSRSLYADLRRCGPFGQGHPAPVFLARGVQVLSLRPTADQKHLRLILKQGEAGIGAVWWGAGGAERPVGAVDVAYRLDLNRWQGGEVLQLVIAGLHAPVPPEQWPVVGEVAPGVDPAVALGDGQAPAAGPADSPADGPADGGAAVAEPGAPYLARPLAQVALVDRRGAPLAAVLAEFAHARIWAEGTGHLPRDAMDRYRLSRCETLVIATPPPGPRVLEEALALTGAAVAVFAWPRPLPSAEHPFLTRLMGLLRHALDRRGGLVTLGELAAGTGELESTAAVGLRALAEAGLLELTAVEGERYRVARGESAGRLPKGPSAARLRQLLRESRAFRAFLDREPVERIRAALQAGP